MVSGAASATRVLTGTFAGTSTKTQITSFPFGNFDNTPASGKFRIDLTGCGDFSFGNPGLGPNCGGYSGPFDSPNTYLTLTTTQGTVRFGSPDYLAKVANSPSSQTLGVNFSFMDPYSSSDLNLVGLTNAFIHGVDFSKLYPGTIDRGASSLRYQDGRSYRGQVTFTSLQFTNVPEPSSWIVLATMMGAGAAGALTRRKNAV